MKKIIFIASLFSALVLIGCRQGTAPMPNPTNKKVLMIIAHQDYQDIEYGTPKKIFEDAGTQVITASSDVSPAQGKLGGAAKVDIILSDVAVSDYDAVIFVGGPGAVNYVNDVQANRIVRESVSQDKVLGAICIAPVILAKVGVLQNKNATVWHATLEDESIQQLREAGAVFINQPVVQDNKIITANGPAAAEEFGRKIVEMLGE